MCKMNKSYENDVNPIYDRKRKQWYNFFLESLLIILLIK